MPQPPFRAPTPDSLKWENIEKLWKEIGVAKKTNDPTQWDQLVGRVSTALTDWKTTADYWPEQVRKYMIVHRHAPTVRDDEQKQKLIDYMHTFWAAAPQEAKDVIKWNLEHPTQQKTLRVPKAEMIQSLQNTLEGIRQGDWNAYPSQVKVVISQWEDGAKREQHALQTIKRRLTEHLEGVQDEKKRAALEKRISDLDKVISNTQHELRQAIGEHNRGDMSKPDFERLLKKVAERIRGNEREQKSIQRRLVGVQKPESRAKIEVWLHEIDNGLSPDTAEKFGLLPGARLRSNEEIRQLIVDKATNEGKYDALTWIITNIAHPVKVLRTKQPYEQRPMKPPYAPPKKKVVPLPGEEEGIEIDFETTPEPPATECQIFMKMISEEKFNLAKKFWLEPYELSVGDLVILENDLKGRIRSVDNSELYIDLFKNDLEIISTKVGLHQAYPYLVG